ncbi:hypothetical protein [Saccharopolyspora hattusasensis]|uniref:hypothetical protein n=1 Tax=Saccharopolyspora hattusasensis TaxID=1128679 RepID=UPI003D953D3A
MGDHVVERSRFFHLRKVSRVERHRPLRGQERRGACAGRPEVRRAGLTEDPAGAVDVHALSEDEDVVDDVTIDFDLRQITHDDADPPVRGLGESGLLHLGQPAEEPDLDGERGLGCGNRLRLPRIGTGGVNRASTCRAFRHGKHILRE